MPRRKNTAESIPYCVKHIRAFADGSGVDCLIDVDGFRYSANVLGDERVTLIGAARGASRGASKRAWSIARDAFTTALRLTVDDAWRETNRVMYAE
jgi:hypothetical protein